MRILGIDIARLELSWVVIDGNRQRGEVQATSPSKVSVPTVYQTDAANLTAMMKLIEPMILERQVERVAIVKATASTSVERAKIELLVQLVCHQLGIDCQLVSPQTISAAKKRKLRNECSPDYEQAIREVSPKYLVKAAMAGWCALDAD